MSKNETPLQGQINVLMTVVTHAQCRAYCYLYCVIFQQISSPGKMHSTITVTQVAPPSNYQLKNFVFL